MKCTRNWASLITLSLTFALAGCGGEDSGPETVSVSGTVSLDKKPLEGAEVNFFSKEGNFLASGMTDAEGNFQLYQGAVAGENQVWISKKKGGNAAAAGDPGENPDLDTTQLAAESGLDEGDIVVAGSELLPAKFSDSAKSVLKYVVPDGGSDAANFDLTSE